MSNSRQILRRGKGYDFALIKTPQIARDDVVCMDALSGGRLHGILKVIQLQLHSQCDVCRSEARKAED